MGYLLTQFVAGTALPPPEVDDDPASGGIPCHLLG
jgi:hypothetical protein